MARNLEEVENRRLEVQKSNIDTAKEAAIRASEGGRKLRSVSSQSSIRSAAVLLPPIPVFLLGVYIFIRRAKARTGKALSSPPPEGGSVMVEEPRQSRPSPSSS